MDKVRNFLKELCGALSSARMFPADHPQFRTVLLKSYHSLDEILKEQNELIIGIVEEELIFEKEVLFELNALMKVFITAAQKKGIEKIHFGRGVKEEELASFVSLLISKKEITGNLQDYFAVLGIHHIKVSKLTTPLEERKKEFVSEVQIYENTVKELSAQIERFITQKATANIYMDLKFILFSIMENFSGQYGEFALLFDDKGIAKDIAHSFNVAALSVQFAQGLGFRQEDILELGIAALLHDIGRIYVDRKKIILGSETGVPSQAVLGTGLLLKYEEFLSSLPVIVAYECYLKPALGVMPDGLLPLAPHITSQIVAISDYYDTYHLDSNQQSGYSPQRLYEHMIQEQEQHWSADLLNEFFKIIGVWPTGTLVALSDGNVAVVREQNRRDIFLPKVEVIDPPQQRRFLDLKKGRGTIGKYLNPLTDGRPYLQFI